MKVTAHFFTTAVWTRTAKSALTAFAVAALLAAGPNAYGGALFVDVNDADCADAGDNLYCQIQDAVDDAVEGDTIQVRAGTYERIVIDTDNITIQGIGGGEVIIDAAGLEGGIGVTLNADGVMIRRLTVENAEVLQILDPFQRIGGHGFLVAGNSNELDGNTARDNGSVGASGSMGFSVSGDFNRLSANTAHGNKSGGFDITGNSNALNANTSVDNGNGYIVGGDSNTLRGNLAEENINRGFFVPFSVTNATLEGNTARDNGRDGFLLFISANSNTLRGNLAEGNGTRENPGRNFGFALVGGCNDNVLQGNSAVDNDGAGFAVSGSNFNLFKGNVARGNGEGGFLIVDDADSNAFENNTSMRNAGWGFFVDAVLSNTFSNNNCQKNDLGGSNVPGICD